MQKHQWHNTDIQVKKVFKKPLPKTFPTFRILNFHENINRGQNEYFLFTPSITGKAYMNSVGLETKTSRSTLHL